ncbi:MAG TPA: DUF1800 domain-containing protein [Rhizomicrobium sp.]|jgi:uncharacterized protein (DUF1800 family)
MIDKATALHLSNRLGFGPAPGDIERIGAQGLDGWLGDQLHPDTSKLPPSVTSALRELPSFGLSSADAYARYWWRDQVTDPAAISKEEKTRLKKSEKQVVHEAQIARLARAVGSPWQLQEALVEFWFNHFNVYEKKGPIKVWIGSYEEEAIRPHTLGRFSDLLLATAKHPAMLVYLDSTLNVAPMGAGQDKMASARPEKKRPNGINENYAREVMELHTLGVEGGYTQQDVISLAHILTGWTVGPGAESEVAAAADKFGRNRGAFRFAQRRHDPSPEALLGRRFSGDDAAEGEAALLMLATHPATANHISFQLAQYFVTDKPDSTLVGAMAMTFRATGGDIRSVMHTMLASTSFLDAANFGTKFKTPYRYVVSAARAAGVPPANVHPLVHALQDLGQTLYGCVSPDGYACTQSAWLDPDALLHRIAFATQLGEGEYGASVGADGAPAPLDPTRIEKTLAPALGRSTLAILSETPKDRRAGAILGSPDFMRC